MKHLVGASVLAGLLIAGAAAAETPMTPLQPAASPAGGPAAAIKTGRWQFTAQLQTGAAPQPGGLKTTYTACIASDNAVPAEFGSRCTLDKKEQHNADVSWSMTCPDTKVHSDGVAQYRGDTMQGTLISHLPGANGGGEMRQHITGRYLGPCPAAAENRPQKTENAVTAAPAAASTTETRSQAAVGSAEPAPTTQVKDQPAPVSAAPAGGPERRTDQGQTSSAAAQQLPAHSAAPAPVEPAPEHAEARREHRRYAHRGERHRRHYARRGYRTYWYGGYGGGYSMSSAPHPFGPSPYSAGGP